MLTRDPAGNETITTWNLRNQPVREEVHWRDEAGAVGTPMRIDTHFDARGRLVRTDVRRLGLGGAIDAEDPRATTIVRHDQLGRVVVSIVELAPVPETLLADLERSPDWEAILAGAGAHRAILAVTRTYYTPDGKVSRVEHPEATLGRVPGRVEVHENDERGMPFRSTLAPGTADELVTQTDHDGNGNVIRVIEGVGRADARVTRNVYDELDRLRVTIDPMGNEAHRSYVNGTLVDRQWVMGQAADVPGNAGAVCLAATRTTYDGLWRTIAQHVASFDDPPATCDGLFAAFPTGWTTTSQQLTLRGTMTSSTDALGRVTTYDHDTLGRLVATVAPNLDATHVSLDINSVPVSVKTTETSDLGGLVISETSALADSLGRIVVAMDAAGHGTRTEYGEGKRVLRVTDALGACPSNELGRGRPAGADGDHRAAVDLDPRAGSAHRMGGMPMRTPERSRCVRFRGRSLPIRALSM